MTKGELVNEAHQPKNWLETKSVGRALADAVKFVARADIAAVRQNRVRQRSEFGLDMQLQRHRQPSLGQHGRSWKKISQLAYFLTLLMV